MEYSPDTAPETGKHKFILFVSGMSVKSGRAIENLKKICDKHLEDNFELQIVDISREKDQAVNYQIVGIPTLIKIYPDPPRIILGDLSDTQKVLKILNIEE
jgi:circadian clock protein KaiB